MERLLGPLDAATSPAAIVARVAADARRSFGAVADDATLDRLARQAIDELCGDSIKVTTFVPVLAMRRIREALDAGSVTRTTIAGGA